MEFKKFSIGTTVYPDEQTLPLDPDGSMVNEKLFSHFDPSDPEMSKVFEFYQFMALCHKVFIDPSQEEKYQSPSPDEIALVKASGNVGIRLTKVTKGEYEIESRNQKETYKILHEFSFSST